MDGQKVPLPRPRVRRKCGTEAPLGSYELFQRGSLIGEAVWTKVIPLRAPGQVATAQGFYVQVDAPAWLAAIVAA